MGDTYMEKMEILNNVCPTEMLIDLNDKECSSAHFHRKEVNGSLNTLKSRMNFKGKEDTSSDNRLETYQSILDVSPTRIGEDEFKQNITLNADVVQNLNLCGNIDDCPTAILVDVPSNSSFYSKKDFISNSAQHYEEDKLSDSKRLDAENQADVKEIYDTKICSETETSDDSAVNDTKNQIPFSRLRWKTPSPQSMCRISKEASNVIHNLNSSDIFDEDSLLTEEILPIPINFEDFDLDDNVNQQELSGTDNTLEKEQLNLKLSINEQTQNQIQIDTKIIQDKAKCHSFPEDSIQTKIIRPYNSQNITILSSENCFTNVNLNISNFPDSNSREFCSSEMHSDSPDQITSSSYDEQDDVFVMKHISSADNESIQEKGTQVILTKEVKNSKTSNELCSPEICDKVLSTSYDVQDNVLLMKSVASEDKENIQKNQGTPLNEVKVTNKTPCKSLFMSRMKECRGTLRNLSNIEYEDDVSKKYPSPSDNKKLTTPLKKIVFSPKMKDTQLLAGKFQLKKPVSSVLSQNKSKIAHQSNSFQRAKELIRNTEKPFLAMKDAPFSTDSLSSEVKQPNFFTKMKTPSKRYSLGTPLKSASAMKPPRTPALSYIQNPSAQRYAPQSLGPRFSFSKSWQQSSNMHHLSTTKGSKHQNLATTAVSSNMSKIPFGRINPSKQEIRSFSQSMSATSFQSFGKSAMSTSSKRKFCSKLSLPSPLPVKEDRKLARALFPSVPEK